MRKKNRKILGINLYDTRYQSTITEDHYTLFTTFPRVEALIARYHISGLLFTLNLVPAKKGEASDDTTPAPKDMVAEPSTHGLAT